MVIFGLIVTASLVRWFFRCLRRTKESSYFDAVLWILSFFWFGILGVALGAIISFAIGNHVVPSEFVLVETCNLEPVIAEGKEVFAIKNRKSNFCNYFYFTKGELDDCPLEVDSILLEDNDIKFREGEVKRMLNKYKRTPKGNLKWFFFSSKSKNELVLISKKDIL